jgi:hypothetical protein
MAVLPGIKLCIRGKIPSKPRQPDVVVVPDGGTANHTASLKIEPKRNQVRFDLARELVLQDRLALLAEFCKPDFTTLTEYFQNEGPDGMVPFGLHVNAFFVAWMKRKYHGPSGGTTETLMFRPAFGDKVM